MGEKKSLSLEGVVIISREYRDSDRSVILFTRERGKLSFVARGVRKLTSKNRGSTDLFIQGEYLLSRGKAYYILNQGKILESYLHVRRDLEKSSIAMTMAAFLNEVLVENSPQPEVYELFLWSLKHLETSKDPMFLLRYFLIKAILFLGHKPILEGCSGCGAGEGEFFFHFEEGSLFCGSCTNTGFRIEKELIELYRSMEKDDFSLLRQGGFTRVQLEKFDFFLEKLIEHIIEKRFSGFDYLKKLTF